MYNDAVKSEGFPKYIVQDTEKSNSFDDSLIVFYKLLGKVELSRHFELGLCFWNLDFDQSLSWPESLALWSTTLGIEVGMTDLVSGRICQGFDGLDELTLETEWMTWQRKNDSSTGTNSFYPWFKGIMHQRLVWGLSFSVQFFVQKCCAKMLKLKDKNVVVTLWSWTSHIIQQVDCIHIILILEWYM